MFISALIPVFNRPIELKRAIESVLNQSEAVDELIIVDDGSTDETVAVIAHYQQLKKLNIVCIQQQNKGVSAARNVGIKKAKGEWIALLDSDDEWQSNKIKTFKNYVAEHASCQFFHSDEIWIRKGVRVNAMKKHQKRGGNIFKHCLPLCVISPSASIINQHVFKQFGLFDEQLPVCEDYDLWLRICHQLDIDYLDKSLIIKHGGHVDQLSTKYWGMDRFRIKALIKLLKSDFLNAEYRVLTQAMLCKKIKILLKGAHKHQNHEVISQFSPLLDQYCE